MSYRSCDKPSLLKEYFYWNSVSLTLPQQSLNRKRSHRAAEQEHRAASKINHKEQKDGKTELEDEMKEDE